jgi:hypothetical protein
MKEEIKNFYLAAGRVIKKYTEVESTFTKTSVYGNLVDNSRNGEMLKRGVERVISIQVPKQNQYGRREISRITVYCYNNRTIQINYKKNISCIQITSC